MNEKMNDKLDALKTKVAPVLNNAKKIAIIIVAMSFGFTVNLLYNKYTNIPKCESEATKAGDTHVLNATSVAINERNELMIIDRKTGTYETYDAEVGNTIFTLYANQMYSQKTK